MRIDLVALVGNPARFNSSRLTCFCTQAMFLKLVLWGLHLAQWAHLVV